MQPSTDRARTPLTEANLRWLDAFIRERGRQPRVLHIGNIANNGYNNAKLLNEAGFDCDVICYDYYHCMGCPEWEDADLRGKLVDEFQPDWRSHDLGNFQRPPWFAQGPLWLCMAYLRARHRASTLKRSYWRYLGVINRTAPPATAVTSGQRENLISRLRIIGLGGMTTPRAIRSILNFTGWFHAVLRVSPERAWRALSGRVFGSRIGKLLGTMVAIPAFGAWWALSTIASIARRLSSGTTEAAIFDRNCSSLISGWSTEFPDRKDALTSDDLAAARALAPDWKKFLADYDIVIAYATDPIYPLVAGKKYFAFEHGTIRDIPYADDARGRCTSIAYRRAEHVFVTNFDCRFSAERLAPGRFTLLNHPYDEDHGLAVRGSEETRSALTQELGCQLLCFFPTRHDWVAGTGYADKANDIFLRAVGALAQQGKRIGVVCCAWGANVEQSKQLIAELGIKDLIRWEAPMALVQFERTARACDLVVDQFMLGAFGGIFFKAMAVGSPILTYLDEGKLAGQYQQMPPILNCATTPEIIAELGRLHDDPRALESLRTASRKWIVDNHGKRDTVNRQVDQFRVSLA